MFANQGIQVNDEREFWSPCGGWSPKAIRGTCIGHMPNGEPVWFVTLVHYKTFEVHEFFVTFDVNYTNNTGIVFVSKDECLKYLKSHVQMRQVEHKWRMQQINALLAKETEGV